MIFKHLCSLFSILCSRHMRTFFFQKAYGNFPVQFIIAMTANVFAEDIAKTRGAGMDAHLIKPIDLDQVCRALHKVVRKEKKDEEYGNKNKTENSDRR